MAARGEDLAPLECRRGRADDDDPVAGLDRLDATRRNNPLAADDRRHLGVGRDPCLAEPAPDDVLERAAPWPLCGFLGRLHDRDVSGLELVRRRDDVELDDLHLSIGEDVGLPRCRDSDRAQYRMRGLVLGRDHEVDVELPFAPHFEVLDVCRPDDRLGLGGEPAREDRGDHVGFVT
jgi:hypothetical protein